MGQKTRNNALDAFCGLETILMPLSQHPQKESFLPHASLPRAKLMVNIYNTFCPAAFYIRSLLNERLFLYIITLIKMLKLVQHDVINGE